jgi:acetolactate synthase-1/2/3 large subunit
MKTADYVAKYLARNGVRYVFEMAGGMITHLLDSIHHGGGTRIVSMHHEQGAAFAADAVGRISGVPGVAMATSGPGATNLITGIGSCYFDSSPAVFITGQVNRSEQKGSRQIRQLGFQETDIVSVCQPITKAAWRADEPGKIPDLLSAAFRLAVSGRPGPVLLDIPMDVQRADIDAADPAVDPPSAEGPDCASADVEKFFLEALRAMSAAERPLILIGGGIRSARVERELRALVASLGVPVVASLMAIDVLPWEDPLRVGFIGTYGNRWSNIALSESDCLLVLGSRLDVRQTGADTGTFKGSRPIFHVDCEAGEINNRVEGCSGLVCTLQRFFSAVPAVFAGQSAIDCSGWLAHIAELRAQWPDTAENPGVAGISPNTLMHELSRASRAATAYVVDVGQHQMWAAQSLEISDGQRFLTSGGMGSMGFALPAAIGTAVVTNGPVVVIAGDGGFQSNIQELETVAHLRLPLKAVVVDNGCHGMVRQFQESYFGRRYQSTVWGYSAPDFARVADAFGIHARTIETPEMIKEGVDWLWSDATSPALLHVRIASSLNTYPKIAFGRPMSEMEPFASPIDIEST